MLRRYFNRNKKVEKRIKNKDEEENVIENKLFFLRIIINIALSLFVILIFFMMWNLYNWKLFLFILIWSFFPSSFYIISITFIDIFIYTKKNKCEKMNNWVRNYFLRIFFPFSFGAVVIYWELVLLGEKYIDIKYTLKDIIKNFFINGLVLIFVLFDVFTSHHINKNNNIKWDIIIINSIIIFIFILIIICKEFLNVYQWNFLIIADSRQIIGSFIIIYLIILNGYVIIYLISDNFFEEEDKAQKNQSKINNKKSEQFAEEFEEKKEKQKINENKSVESINEREDKKVENEGIELNKNDKEINKAECKLDDNNINKITIKRNNNKFINNKKYFIRIPKSIINK